MHSPATLIEEDRPSLNTLKITYEAEFAFKISKGITDAAIKGPGRSDTDRGLVYEREGIIQSIEAVYPAIELVHSIYVNGLKAGLPSFVADCAGNYGLILG